MLELGFTTYGMQEQDPFEALPRLSDIGYDAVAAGGRLYVPVLWDFTLDRESGGTLVALAD
jgi:hypothetical protein